MTTNSNLHIENILEQAFHKSFGVTGIQWNLISDAIELKQCKKGTCLRHSMQYETNINLLLKGAVGSITYKNDKMVCLDLCFVDDFFGDYAALISGEQSSLEIRALTDCHFISIPFEKLLLAYSTIPVIEREKIGRMSAEALYILKHQELI